MGRELRVCCGFSASHVVSSRGYGELRCSLAQRRLAGAGGLSPLRRDGLQGRVLKVSACDEKAQSVPACRGVFITASKVPLLRVFNGLL